MLSEVPLGLVKLILFKIYIFYRQLILTFLFHQYMVSCNNIDQMPDVTFNINGQQFTLPASAYISQIRIPFLIYSMFYNFSTYSLNCIYFFSVTSPP